MLNRRIASKMKCGRFWGTETKILFSIAAVGIALTLPVLILGVPLFSDDGVTHAIWYSHFSEQLWSGDLYPRWLGNMNAGLGSPVFFYYSPVSFFITSLLRPFFPHDSYGLHQVGVSCVIALVTSGISAYLWLKRVSDPLSATIGAILYMSMPYHLGEIYVRGALAELWAFVWLPLILIAARGIVNGRRFAWLVLALSYALLVMTHLPTALIFAPVPIAYAWFVTNKKLRVKTAVITFGSYLISIGLSGVYLLPALFTQENVSIDRMATGYFSYSNWFLFSKWSGWSDDKLVLLLLAADMSIVAACGFLFLRSRDGDDAQKKLSRFWLVTAGASVFMMTELSIPVWRIIFPLQKLQFPWRFNVVLSISATALLVMAIAAWRKEPFASGMGLKIIALTAVAAWFPAMAIEAWTAFPQLKPDPITSAAKKKQIEDSRDAPEYRPRWNQSMRDLDWNASIDIDHWDALLEHEFDSVRQRVNSPAGQPVARIVEGVGRVTMTARKPREIDLHVDTPTGVLVEAPQFYYPNWRAHVLNEPQYVPIEPSRPDGLATLRLPAGSYDVQLRMERSSVEVAGEVVSLGTFAVLILVGIISRQHS